MSIVGKKYIPRDNSYSKNLSSDKRERDFLAGTSQRAASVTTIVSEPFPVIISGRRSKDPLEFVLVKDEYNNTHFVLFIKTGVITEGNPIEQVLVNDAVNRSEYRF